MYARLCKSIVKSYSWLSALSICLTVLRFHFLFTLQLLLSRDFSEEVMREISFTTPVELASATPWLVSATAYAKT